MNTKIKNLLQNVVFVAVMVSLGFVLPVIFRVNPATPEEYSGAELKKPAMQKIVGSEMGWYKLTLEPRLVNSPDAPKDHKNNGLMEVSFRMSETEIFGATIDPCLMNGLESPKRVHWQKGDEVLVVCVPAGRPYIPRVAFYAIDHRPAPKQAEAMSE